MKYTKESGITLIALIITVIIMLILAGVAVFAMNTMGIFDRTREAAELHNNAAKAEEGLLRELDDILYAAKEGYLGEGGTASSKLLSTIEEYINEKLSEIEDYVVESWVAPDNKSWYRKYKSGWLEQGGTYIVPSSGINQIEISYPITFLNSNHNLVCGFTTNSEGGFGLTSILGQTKTVSGFKAWGAGVNTSGIVLRSFRE